MGVSILLILIFIIILIMFKFIRILKSKKNRYALEQYVMQKAAKIFLAISVLKKVSNTLDFLGVLFYIICIDPIGSYFNLIVHIEYVVNDNEVKELIGDDDSNEDKPESKKESILNWKKIVAIVGCVVGLWIWYKYGGGGNEPPQFTPTQNQPITTINQPILTTNQPAQPTEFVEVSNSLETTVDLLTKGSAAALTTIALSTINDNTTQSTITIDEPSIEFLQKDIDEPLIEFLQKNIGEIVKEDIPGLPREELAKEQALVHQTISEIIEQKKSIEKFYNMQMDASKVIHNYSITGHVIEFRFNDYNAVYPVFEMTDVIKDLGLEGITDNQHMCEMASYHGVFVKHPEYSWKQLEEYTKVYMYDQIMCVKKAIVKEHFVDDLDLNTINLSYIYEHNITTKSNLSINKMVEIGGDSVIHFFGYDSIEELYDYWELTDTKNPKYAKRLETAEIIMLETFIYFCKHIKYAINNNLIDRPQQLREL